MNNTKVLVISHNAFSQTNNMGKTLYSLFGDFKKENIIQLYFHVLKPDVEKCKASFCITDRDVLSSIIHPNKCGKIINKNEINASNIINVESKIYQFGQRRTAIKHILRDFIWKVGHWKTEKLIKWLDDFRPDIIFFAAGYSMFSIDIAMFIAKRYDIPLVTYFCDDYYDVTFCTNKYSLISAIRMKLFKEKIRKVVHQSQKLIFITEAMMNKYKMLFNKTGEVIMTPYSISQPSKTALNDPLIISFVGSILINRWKTLVEIGKALKKINSNKLKIILNIYSVATDKAIISRLSIGDSMMFRGTANAEMVKEIYAKSDIVLHVESFLPADINRVRYSVSTKIPDNLASNRAFLAVGPSEIASIEYLKKNKVAYIIDNESLIENKITEYFIKNNIDPKMIANAKRLAEKNHNVNKNSEQLKMIFKRTIQGY